MKVTMEVLSGPMDGEVFSFSKSIEIGHDTTADVPIQVDRFISRRHAKILVVEPECFLEDLQSTNGTFVNDQRLNGRTILRSGQMFKVGKTWMQISW